jgi:hypothetical protein
MQITQGYINDGNVEDIEKQLNSSLPLGFGEKDAVQPYYSDLLNKFFTKSCHHISCQKTRSSLVETK